LLEITRLPQAFDAIVGRFVQMYQDDPVWSLRRITKHLGANGVPAFQELDSTACGNIPLLPTMSLSLNLHGCEPQAGKLLSLLFSFKS